MHDYEEYVKTKTAQIRASVDLVLETTQDAPDWLELRTLLAFRLRQIADDVEAPLHVKDPS